MLKGCAMRQFALLAGSAAVAIALGLSAGYGQDQQTLPPQSPPAANPGMMGNGGMPMMNMMQQMSRMMENCNRMMESHMQQHPAPTPQPEKNG